MKVPVHIAFMSRFKRKVLLSAFLFCSQFVLSINAQTLPFEKKMDFAIFHHVVGNGSQIAAVAHPSDGKRIHLFDGNNWKLLPLTYSENGKLDSIIKFGVSTEFYPAFDPSGNLWVPGLGGLYKYTDNGWNKYTVGDKYDKNRYYQHICFDSNGLIWFTSYYLLGVELLPGNGILFDTCVSEVYTWDGNSSFRLCDTSLYFPQAYGNDRGLMAHRDGSVWVHRSISTTDIGIIKNSLLSFDKQGKKDTIGIDMPHSILNTGRLRNGRIHAMMQDDKGSVWIGLAKPTETGHETGLIKRDNKGLWHSFGSTQNYPTKYIEPIDGAGQLLWDTVYAACNALYQDNQGKIWVGGNGFLNIIDQNRLIVPDTLDFLGNIKIYTWDWPEDPNYFINYKAYFRDSLPGLLMSLFQHGKTWYKAGNCQVQAICPGPQGSTIFAIDFIGIVQYQKGVSAVGQQENLQNGCIQLYPQPANQSLMIQMDDMPMAGDSYTIYDAALHAVHHGELENKSQDISDILPKLPSGTYYAMFWLHGKIEIVPFFVKK
jgi:hypothetical protein